MSDVNILTELIIKKNYELIKNIADKFPTNSVVSTDDYISVGIIAVINAAKNYKHGNWIKYAYVCIRNAIANEANKFCGPFTISDTAIRNRLSLSKLKEKCKSRTALRSASRKSGISLKELCNIEKIIKPLKINIDNISAICSNSSAIINMDCLCNDEKEIFNHLLNGIPLYKIAKTVGINKNKLRKAKEKIIKKLIDNAIW